MTELADLPHGLVTARDALLRLRSPNGAWPGHLASSPLAAATAVGALALADGSDHPTPVAPLIARGIAWMKRVQNDDGGWGDTPDSPSNLSTTLLCLAALRLAGPELGANDTATSAGRQFVQRTAGPTPAEWTARLRQDYGKDRTFAVPIQTMCALAGLMPWESVPPLPFELACLPRWLFRLARLHVVSYALPALIAIGSLRHSRTRSAPTPLRWVRDLATAPTLRRLETMQPADGGFLEAVPLTSFVVMGLAAAGHTPHPVVSRGIAFLTETARDDGSWAIDRDLSTWVTSLSVQALARADATLLADLAPTRAWLRQCQWTVKHPFTGTAPGGWAWTDAPGGVPDADDTAGALVALSLLGEPESSLAAANGIRWLLNLQNHDGGWPTFCRGWNRLPFDRSSPDITAHVLRALRRWQHPAGRRGADAVRRGTRYLLACQQDDGSWLPLWFGNQHTAEHTNPVYGTALVLAGLHTAGTRDGSAATRGVSYLLRTQNRDGGWGGGRPAHSSVEETGAATTALAMWWPEQNVREACVKGAAYLLRRVRDGSWTTPSPIGLYFARLWYWERMYPLIWTVSALGCVQAWQGDRQGPSIGSTTPNRLDR